MHRTLIPLAAFAVLSLVGTAAAQDAAQTSSGSGDGNTGNMEALTCADLNEMEEAEALAFLKGYQYARTSADHSGATASSETSSAESSSSSDSSSSDDSSTSDDSDSSNGVGVATATGDVSEGSIAAAGSADVSSQAILSSCFDMPSAPLDEVLGGDFGAVD